MSMCHKVLICKWDQHGVSYRIEKTKVCKIYLINIINDYHLFVWIFVTLADSLNTKMIKETWELKLQTLLY